MRLAICLHDGFYGCGTGAGLQNWRFLQCLSLYPELIDELYVLPIRLVPENREHDALWHANVRRLLMDLPARVLPIDNGTDGQRRYGGLGEWERASTAAAQQIEDLAADGPLSVVSFDTPFVGLLSALRGEPRVRHVHVPRSTALIHSPDDARRAVWERDNYEVADRRRTRLGAISRYMRRHLIEDYGVQPHALIDVFDGTSRFEWSEEPVPQPPGLVKGPFILCFGRAVPYKGQHVLVEALGWLKQQGVELPRAVIGAVSEEPTTPYADALERRCRELDLDAVIVREFSPWLRDLIGHSDLRVVVVPSLAEPFGRIPIECFSHPNFRGVVVASQTGGLTELVAPGQTGFGCGPGSRGSLAVALDAALRVSPTEALSMREDGESQATSGYNYERTLGRLLKIGQSPFTGKLMRCVCEGESEASVR